MVKYRVRRINFLIFGFENWERPFLTRSTDDYYHFDELSINPRTFIVRTVRSTQFRSNFEIQRGVFRPCGPGKTDILDLYTLWRRTMDHVDWLGSFHFSLFLSSMPVLLR